VPRPEPGLRRRAHPVNGAPLVPKLGSNPFCQSPDPPAATLNRIARAKGDQRRRPPPGFAGAQNVFGFLPPEFIRGPVTVLGMRALRFPFTAGSTQTRRRNSEPQNIARAARPKTPQPRNSANVIPVVHNHSPPPGRKVDPGLAPPAEGPNPTRQLSITQPLSLTKITSHAPPGGPLR